MKNSEFKANLGVHGEFQVILGDLFLQSPKAKKNINMKIMFSM